MSPSANNAHDDIGQILRDRLLPAAREANLRVRLGPNVRLAELRYLIPDLAVGAFGRTALFNAASDTLLVAEVTSPGNAAYDREEKRRLYADAGIAWYLLVEPDFIDYESVTPRLFRLEGHAYVEHAVAKPGETLASRLPFPIEINTDDLIDF